MKVLLFLCLLRKSFHLIHTVFSSVLFAVDAIRFIAAILNCLNFWPSYKDRTSSDALATLNCPPQGFEFLDIHGHCQMVLLDYLMLVYVRI